MGISRTALLAAVCGLAVGGSAMAGEPTRLADSDLDGVTAGAFTYWSWTAAQGEAEGESAAESSAGGGGGGGGGFGFGSGSGSGDSAASAGTWTRVLTYQADNSTVDFDEETVEPDVTTGAVAEATTWAAANGDGGLAVSSVWGGAIAGAGYFTGP